MKYSKGVIISSSKDLFLLLEHIRTNLHLPISIYLHDKKKTITTVNELMEILENELFIDKDSLKKKYEIGEFEDFFIMPVIDFKNEYDLKKEYISGEIFSTHCLKNYIVPIWNIGDLDKILLGPKIVNQILADVEKRIAYRNLVTDKNGEVKIKKINELVESLKKSNSTNIDQIFIKCIEVFEKDNGF